MNASALDICTLSVYFYFTFCILCFILSSKIINATTKSYKTIKHSEKKNIFATVLGLLACSYVDGSFKKINLGFIIVKV